MVSKKYITWVQGGLFRYLTSDVIQHYLHNTYTVKLVREVKLNIEIDGEGVVTSPHFQYSWNPEPYIPQGLTNPPATTLAPMVNANYVSMTPSPCPGWLFDHWEYTDANGETVVVNNPIPGFPVPLGVYMNWWSGEGIRLPNGKEIMDVKAVFQEPRPCGPFGCPDEGCPIGRAVTSNECQIIVSAWPGLDCLGVAVTGESSGAYNCYGYALGSMQWESAAVFDDPLMFGNGDGFVTLEEVETYFMNLGEYPFALYGDPSEPRMQAGGVESEVFHASRYPAESTCADCAESKLGEWIRITHDVNEMAINPNPPPAYGGYGALLLTGAP